MVNGALPVLNSHKNKSSKHKGNTTANWNEIWLAKFENISRIEKFEINRAAQMREKLSVFLSETPGSPYFIHPEIFRSSFKTTIVSC